MDLLTTLVPTAYLAVLALLSLFGVHRLVVLVLYWRHHGNRPAAGRFAELPRVTVQLPVFNERNVVARLVEASCRLDWPRDRFQVQILDDSTDETVVVSRALAQKWRERGVDIEVRHRADRTGYKAGALEAGLDAAKGDYIAIFDADFVPEPGLLRRMMPYFAERPEVGMVQARWGHLNEERNLLTRLSAVLLDGHFVLEHTARNRSGRFFNFNGTAGIWRRDTIADAGGWQHDTLVEDLDLSYRAQLAGWRFVFLQDEVVDAEVPPDVRGFKTQQHRWAKGTVQAARKLLPRVLRADVSLGVKLEAAAHLLSNLAYPAVVLLALLMPPAVLLRGQGDLATLVLLDLPAFGLATCSVALFYAVAEREARGRWLDKAWRLPLVMALGIGISINQSRAVFEGLLGRDVTFVRTPKAGDAGSAQAGAFTSYRPAAGWTPLLELAMAAYLVVGAGLVAQSGWYASLPFLAMFAAGFGYVGLASLLPVAETRAADAPATEGAAAEPRLTAAS
jgi:cellulose synthase/poly-beta-1,6-N-acetylglucosamine synthase-like glycosyltransferase